MQDNQPPFPDDAVLLERDGAVGIMRFNRRQAMNTLEPAMLRAMDRALQALQDDAAVRTIVVTGVDDRSFIAGGNIRDLDSRNALEHYRDFAPLVHGVFQRFEACPKPVIAAVNGWALGGGAEFLLTTDIRLMAEEAQLGLPEIKLGLFPGGGGSQRLMRQIPLCQAKLLMFTGDFIDAHEAVRLGLVNRAVPRARLMEETLALARRIAAYSPWALKLLKGSMLHGGDMPLHAALQHEAATMSLLLDTEDAHEGCRAFLEKRPPNFCGY